MLKMVKFEECYSLICLERCVYGDIIGQIFNLLESIFTYHIKNWLHR